MIQVAILTAIPPCPPFSYYHFYFHMPPKKSTSFSIPMGDVDKNAAQPKKAKRGIRATEEDVPLPSSKGKKSGKASGSRQQVYIPTQGLDAHATGHPTHDTEESHPLRSTEAYEEESQDFQTDERNVRIWMPSHMTIALIICRHLWTNG
jgi:hypothetical protein